MNEYEKPIDKKNTTEAEKRYNAQWIVSMAEKTAPEEEAKSKKRKPRGKIWSILLSVFIAGFIVVMAIQIPDLMETTKPGKPIRLGSYDTDDATDQCIKNLWQISRLLQEGKTPDASIVCPVSKIPYRVKSMDYNIIVSCPNPEKHRFTIVQVQKATKIPEVRK